MTDMQMDSSIYRSMDLITYVLYSKDECFVRDMVDKVVKEVMEQHAFPEIGVLLQYEDRPVLFRCLFFLMLNFHTQFRSWVLSAQASKSNGLPPLCQYKMTRFLVNLRETLIPSFLVHDEISMEDFDYQIKTEYVRS